VIDRSHGKLGCFIVHDPVRHSTSHNELSSDGMRPDEVRWDETLLYTTSKPRHMHTIQCSMIWALPQMLYNNYQSCQMTY